MVNREDLYRRLNEGVVAERRRAFEANLRKNLDLIKRHGGLSRLVRELQGKHVIVVGAGPSLEGALPLLRELRERREVSLISADMALRPLVKSGVFPHYVISCETTPAGFFASLPTERMHLLAFSCGAASHIRAWKGDISFYNWMLHGEPYDGLWDIAGRGLGFVATASIVATQAVSIALGCAIRSLFLVGNDMGFSRSYYVKGTVWHQRRCATSSRFTPVETTEQAAMRLAREYVIHRGGRVFHTSAQFLSARLWLEELFRKRKVPIYDNSIPGCDGTAVVKVEMGDYARLLEGRQGGGA
jgi:hypothetical protein